MLRWKVKPLAVLKEAGYNQTVLLKENLIGQASVASLRHDKMVGIITLDKICKLTKMQPGDLIEWIED